MQFRIGRIDTAAVIAALLMTIAGIAVTEPLDTSFTYQGEINQNGSPLDGTADFQFSLYDAIEGGNQVDATLAINSVTVTNGIFAALLDFGVEVFTGDARYLEIALRAPAGGGSFTTLSPRVTLTATPYALQTRGIFVNAAGDVSIGTAGDALEYQAAGAARERQEAKVEVEGENPTAVLGVTTKATGLSQGMMGISPSDEGRGVVGEASSTSGQTRGVLGISHSPVGIGVKGEGATGVHGTSDEPGGKGIVGEATGIGSTIGVEGKSLTGDGVMGEGTTGVRGASKEMNGKGIVGEATGGGNTVGVEGKSVSGEGVTGEGTTGVRGASKEMNGKGIVGEATGGGNTVGVEGKSVSGEGVTGEGMTGVRGLSKEINGRGMIGEATGPGIAIGVEGRGGPSAGSIGVSGEASTGVGGQAPVIGVRGHATDPYDLGVVGYLGTGPGIPPPWIVGTGVLGITDPYPYPFGPVHGVHGYCPARNEESSGVLAEGFGVEVEGQPSAAALDIRNGALRVSGQHRPAGTLIVDAHLLTWTPINSCNQPTGPGGHSHNVGMEAVVDLFHPLINHESIVLLTVEACEEINDICLPYGVSVMSRGPGLAKLALYRLGTDDPLMCSPPGVPPLEVRIHYLVISNAQ